MVMWCDSNAPSQAEFAMSIDADSRRGKAFDLRITHLVGAPGEVRADVQLIGGNRSC